MTRPTRPFSFPIPARTDGGPGAAAFAPSPATPETGSLPFFRLPGRSRPGRGAAVCPVMSARTSIPTSFMSSPKTDVRGFGPSFGRGRRHGFFVGEASACAPEIGEGAVGLTIAPQGAGEGGRHELFACHAGQPTGGALCCLGVARAVSTPCGAESWPFDNLYLQAWIESARLSGRMAAIGRLASAWGVAPGKLLAVAMARGRMS